MTSVKNRVNDPETPLKKEKLLKPVDFPMLFIVLLLLAVGLMMLLSAGHAASLSKTGDSYFFIRRQLIWAAVGIAGMFVASIFPAKLYTMFVPLFYVFSVSLLVLVLIVSKDPEKRWLYIGSVQFQPSEFAKLAVIMALAQYMKKNRNEMKKFIKGFVVPFLIFAVPAFLVGIETHLSGAILIFGVGFIMIVVGGSNKIFCGIAVVLGIIGVVAAVLLVPYIQKRVEVWLNPTVDLLNSGHQPYQSLITIGSGGLFGLGYGKSRQKYLFLPEPQNDCIFSITAEEIGFIGVVLIIILFAFLIWRGIYISVKSNNMFSSLLAMGIITRVALQVILNLCVVTNSTPTTGIALPFFSYGGTALSVLLVEMGLVLGVSRDMNSK
ncbi:MAG: cell division protein FtsW [Clostridia bacterium]|nr:cell division protein FtsW [Clostridia bacterium]